jgi:hypothetical protein
MKLYRINYRTEVFIRAPNEGAARGIFESADLVSPDLSGDRSSRPDEAGLVFPEEYVEIVSLEEYPPDFLE